MLDGYFVAEVVEADPSPYSHFPWKQQPKL